MTEKINYKIVEDPNEGEAWDKLVGHPLQSWAWGDFRSKRQDISRLGVYKDGKLINAFLIVWTKIKLTPFCIGYIPMGNYPSSRDIKQIQIIGKKMGAIAVRIEPDFMSKKDNNALLTMPQGRALFKPKTFVIDLNLSEEELLAKMHPKGRYNIKIAAKHGVICQEDNSAESLEAYLELMFLGTAKRQGIYMHGPDYHQQMWNALRVNNMATLWTAKYKNKILAADIIFRFNDRIYYAYGASALEHKEVMASSGLLWEIIKWGKTSGATKFDLWGAEQGKGFSRFKEHFGGDLVNLPGSYDLVVRPILYPFFRFLEEARWQIIHKLK